MRNLATHFGLVVFTLFLLTSCGDDDVAADKPVEAPTVATLDSSGRKTSFKGEHLVTCLVAGDGAAVLQSLNLHFRKSTGEAVSLLIQHPGATEKMRSSSILTQGASDNVVSFTDASGATYSTDLAPTSSSKNGTCHVVLQGKAAHSFNALSIHTTCSSVQGTQGANSVGSMVFKFEGFCRGH